ncbi:hypothetical protein IWW38_004536, partial [Coemansia aciculifera]
TTTSTTTTMLSHKCPISVATACKPVVALLQTWGRKSMAAETTTKMSPSSFHRPCLVRAILMIVGGDSTSTALATTTTTGALAPRRPQLQLPLLRVRIEAQLPVTSSRHTMAAVLVANRQQQTTWRTLCRKNLPS